MAQPHGHWVWHHPDRGSMASRQSWQTKRTTSNSMWKADWPECRFQKKQLDEILVAALFSLNSSTYQYGRSPYQAVFGRVPRPVGDLISDNKALVISPQLHPEQQSLQPELLRAEALAALAQFSASQAVRRAILRKTGNQNDLHNLQPGQTGAFWRMQGRSRQHKKGSWNLARFLAFDPDRKSCWVQLGKTSLRVGTTQLRAAAGWENWTPSSQDIELIKNAENNISRGLWLDETGAPPTEEDAMNVDEELFNFRQQKMPPLPPQDTSMIPEEEVAMLGDRIEDYDMASMPPEFQQTAQTEAAMQPYTMATLPAAPHSEQATSSNIHTQRQLNIHHQQQQQDMSQYNYDQRQITVNMDSPTFKSYGPNPSFGRLPLTPRSQRASGPYGQPAPSTPVQQAVTQVTKQRPVEPPLALSAPAPGSIQDPKNMTADTPIGTAEQQAPADIQTLLTTYDDNTETFRSKHWDGSPDISSRHQQCQQAYTAYLASNRRKVEMKGLGHQWWWRPFTFQRQTTFTTRNETAWPRASLAWNHGNASSCQGPICPVSRKRIQRLDEVDWHQARQRAGG